MLKTEKLRVGDRVRLNSGSPDSKVVACDARKVAVEWHNGTDSEIALFPRVCVYRTDEISN